MRLRKRPMSVPLTTTSSFENSPKPSETKTFPGTSICCSCYTSHLVNNNLAFPLSLDFYSKYLPISSIQQEWPDISIVDKYIEDYGNHVCESCVSENACWKRLICINDRGCHGYGATSVKVCKNNLVTFRGLRWWNKTCLPN